MTDTHMQPRDLVLTVIGQCGDSEEFGRTSLQKVTYLTSLVLDVDLGYGAYFYGPFSSTVEADAEALTLSGLASETVTHMGVSPRGYDLNKYRYQITDSGRERLERVKSTYPRDFELAQKFATQIHDVVGSFDQATLSAAAKTLYIARDQQRPITADEVRTLAKDLGWKLSTSKIDKVTKMLADLNLVTVTSN